MRCYRVSRPGSPVQGRPGRPVHHQFEGTLALARKLARGVPQEDRFHVRIDEMELPSDKAFLLALLNRRAGVPAGAVLRSWVLSPRGALRELLEGEDE